MRKCVLVGLFVRSCVVFAADGAGIPTGLTPDSVEARVRQTEHGPQLFIDGKAVVPRMCHVAENPRFHDHLTSTVRRAKKFGGVDLVSLATHKTDAGWREDGCEDWTLLDDLCDKVVRSNPDAKFFPRVRLFAPRWYLQAHPEEQVTFEDGTKAEECSVSSRAYRKVASDYLRRMIVHLEKKYARHFIGVQVTSQATGEFLYPGGLKKLDGYDAATLAAWRAYLHAQGESDAATADVPSPAERRTLFRGERMLDPVVQRRLVQFARFRQLEMADALAHYCHVAREATAGRKLVLAFYGYTFELTRRTRVGPAESGHHALQHFLDVSKDDIDIICSPVSYSDRAYWSGIPSMGADETVMRAGILHLEEDDFRTYLDHRPGQDYLMEGTRVDMPMSQKLMRRVTSVQGIRGFASWWMDLLGVGWYDSPELWDVQKDLMPWEYRLLARRRPYSADLALVVGEESICSVSPAADPQYALGTVVRGASLSAARAGIPYGQWLQSDVARQGVDARLQFMLAPWCLTDEEERALALTRGLPKGGLRAWYWAPGLFNGLRQRDEARMERICGFKLMPCCPSTNIVCATERGCALGLPGQWSLDADYTPYFTPSDATEDETLARWPDGRPAIAVRRFGESYSAFVGVPGSTPQLVRALGEIAGVHFYFAREDIGRLIVWATDGFLGFQTEGEGPCEILLPKGVDCVFDACTNQRFGESGRLKLNLGAGESRFYWYDD